MSYWIEISSNTLSKRFCTEPNSVCLLETDSIISSRVVKRLGFSILEDKPLIVNAVENVICDYNEEFIPTCRVISGMTREEAVTFEAVINGELSYKAIPGFELGSYVTLVSVKL